MSAMFSPRAKDLPNAGCVEMWVVRPMLLPTFASPANNRKCCGNTGVKYSNVMLAENSKEVAKRKRCPHTHTHTVKTPDEPQGF
jgi:hypothetical protein